MVRSLLLWFAASGLPAHAAPEAAGCDCVADAPSTADLEGSADTIVSVARAVHGLSPDRTRETAHSLQTLSTHCPYTRAALQLPFALHAVAVGIDASQLDPAVREDWTTLREGLATHVGVLDALGVDLPMPGLGDSLEGAEPGWMVDRAALLADDDPIGRTALLVQGITPLAAAIQAHDTYTIHHHSDRVEALTGVVRPCPRGPSSVLPGHPWTLGLQLGQWHDLLERVAPAVDDPELRATVDAMRAVLDAYGEAAFATRPG
jgi:hypothetical protein